MKLLTEYLEHVVTFERLAAGGGSQAEGGAGNSATAYRKLAADRAVKYGLPLPGPRDTSAQT